MANILVVDDSWLLRAATKKILINAGHSVTEAGDGEEGLAKVDEINPELIVLDLLMPKIDGIGVLEELKKRNSDIPVIVLSADIQETTRKKCFDLGIFGFANKPPKEAELLEFVENALV